jgi:phage-related baseplate assembly protein
MAEPVFELDDLIEPVTRDEVQQSVYDALGTLGVNTTAWKSGSVVRTMIVAVSAVMAAFSTLQAEIARSGFLEFASGNWLTLVARYVYGVERITATFATGDVTLHNTGGGVYAFDPDDLIFANTVTGATYRNTEPVTLAPSADVTVPISATEPGSGSSAGPGEITVMVTVVLGVSCTNEHSLTGADEEKDAALRTRAQAKLGALSPMGPWDAYAYAVRTATYPDGTSIGVTRIRITKDGYGNVTVYCAGAEGGIDGSVSDPSSALGIANAAVQKNAAPLGVNAVVVSAVEQAMPVTYEVWLYNTTPLDDAGIRSTIAKAIEAFFVEQPIGGNVVAPNSGKIFRDAIVAAIHDSMPEVFHVFVTVPASDVALTPESVAVAGAITVTAVHLEPPPEGHGGSL